jgi:hypothetical protein
MYLPTVCRYEEQASRLATVEAAKRALEVQALRSGASVGEVGSRPSTACPSALLTPNSRRVSLGGFASSARRHSLCVNLPAELRSAASEVQRKLEFGDRDGAVAELISPQTSHGENATTINLMPLSLSSAGAGGHAIVCYCIQPRPVGHDSNR